MARVIHKKNLLIHEDQVLYITGTVEEILCVQIQNDNPQIWYVVNSGYGNSEIRMKMVGTGWEPPVVEKYIGTTQLKGFVWHWFYEIVVRG